MHAIFSEQLWVGLSDSIPWHKSRGGQTPGRSEVRHLKPALVKDAVALPCGCDGLWLGQYCGRGLDLGPPPRTPSFPCLCTKLLKSVFDPDGRRRFGGVPAVGRHGRRALLRACPRVAG